MFHREISTPFSDDSEFINKMLRLTGAHPVRQYELDGQNAEVRAAYRKKLAEHIAQRTQKF